MSSNINEWTLSEIIARREHLAMCKKRESSAANIVESVEKALNTAEAANEHHNVEVFKKASKLYREHSEGSRGSDKRHGREIDAKSRWCL